MSNRLILEKESGKRGVTSEFSGLSNEILNVKFEMPIKHHIGDTNEVS